MQSLEPVELCSRLKTAFPHTTNFPELVNRGVMPYRAHNKVAIMCLQAICCNIHEFCCNGLQGVTWSYMAIHDNLVCVTAIFFAIM
jgi:hypothetical protein